MERKTRFIISIGLCLLTFSYIFTISSISYIILGLYLAYFIANWQNIKKKYNSIFLENKVILALIILVGISCFISSSVIGAEFHSYRLLRQRIEWMLVPFLLGSSISILPMSVKKSCMYVYYTCAICLIFISINLLYQGFFLHVFRPSEWLSHDYCNTIAGIIAFCMCCSFCDLVRTTYEKLFISIVWILCIGALYVLETRGAIVGIIFSICIIVIYIISCIVVKKKACLSSFLMKVITITVMLVIIFGSISMIFPSNVSSRIYKSIYSVERLYDGKEKEAVIHQDIIQGGGDRIYLWKSSVKMIEDYPLFGIGIGNFNQVYISQNYISPYANEKNLVSPHNIYLHVFTESGLLGGIPFLLLLGYMIYYLVNSLKNKNKLALGILLGYIAVLVQGFVDFPFLQRELSQVVWFYFGIVVSINVMMRREQNV